jgi:hypothetical protein
MAWSSEPGTEVRVVLPGGNDPVMAHTARARDGHLALAFRRDNPSIMRIDQAPRHIAGVVVQ